MLWRASPVRHPAGFHRTVLADARAHGAVRAVVGLRAVSHVVEYDRAAKPQTCGACYQLTASGANERPSGDPAWQRPVCVGLLATRFTGRSAK